MNVKRRNPADVPDPQEELTSARPYSVLAAGYDVVMEHVEYDAWAEYVHDLIQHHHAAARTVLELGCGTGSLALELQPLGSYRYAATDGSPDMVAVARAKAELYGVEMQFAVADFANFRVDVPVDVVILLYDGLNYLLEEDRVRALFACVAGALKPGGIFVFDQSTPSNSIRNERYFEDQGQAEGFSYVRHSRYDREKRLHTTIFEVTAQGERFREEHVQRAYELAEIRSLLADAPFDVEAVYDNFSTDPATEASDRAHWVLRRRA